MSSKGRVSIPGNVRQMIHNIKEITGNHSEEEIHAMLKECSMDPNETAQKLLLQDTFHEVKRKPRKKEILNKEPAESRWKPGMQGRGNRGGRGIYSSRPTSHDAGGKNNSASGKENVTNHSEGGGTMPATSQDKKHAEATFVLSSSTAVADGQSVVHSESIVERTVQRADVAVVVVVVPPIEAKKPLISSPSGVYFSASDPVLLPSQESRVQNTVGTIRREVGIHRTQPQRKSTTVFTANKSQGGGKNPLSESFQPAVSTHTSPSVNYTSRSQQVIGPQKVAPSKEWKPKPNPNLAQSSSGTVTSSQVLTTPAVEAHNNDKSQSQSQPDELNATVVSKENISEVEKKLEKSLHISESQSQQQHVVIPNHLHVPGAEKLGFCFGSFDASFGLNTISNTSVSENDATQQPLSESSEDESAEEQHLSRNWIMDPGSRHMNLKKSFNVAMRSLLTTSSKEEFCKVFSKFTKGEQELLRRLFIQVITSLHERIESEFKIVCHDTQMGPILDTVEELVQEQRLDYLIRDKTSVGDILQSMTAKKKTEIQLLTGMLQEVEEQKSTLKARIQLLKKEYFEDLSGVKHAVVKLKTRTMN